jgi:hypothetical protein
LIKVSLIEDLSVVPELNAREAQSICALMSSLSGTESKGCEGLTLDEKESLIRKGVLLCTTLSKENYDLVNYGPSLILDLLLRIGECSANDLESCVIPVDYVDD